MELIDEFVARYVKEMDFYEQAARFAARRLEAALQAEGIRCIVTSRVKSPQRLEDKLRQRNGRRLDKNEKPYETVDEIYSDIVDLAGVRVALYFPGEKEQVGNLISRLFTEYQPRRVFTGSSSKSPDKRFNGYSALHYRIRLPATETKEFDPRYAQANIEVQVASVLMHAWAEVEHDLVYKPYGGDLSAAELSLLDQLNGLVMAGEISLEQLQAAAKSRVAEVGRSFKNHYELAAYILARQIPGEDQPISDEGLGRVDLLFSLLVKLGITTPNALGPYLEVLHGDLERRPIAEQIIDALLAEDPDRYGIYRAIRESSTSSSGAASVAGTSDGPYIQVGFFLTQWIKLEQLLARLSPARPRTLPPGSISFRALRQLPILTEDGLIYEIEFLRRIRNLLVHGIEMPSPEALEESGHRIDGIIEEIQRRISSARSNGTVDDQGKTLGQHLNSLSQESDRIVRASAQSPAVDIELR